MKKIHFVIGVIVGAILFGSISVISSNIIAMLSEQVIYVDGERVEMLAYHIGGNNFVRLRDIGRAVGFGVTFDETTGSVHIDSNSPYVDEYTIRQAREYYLILRGEFGRVRHFLFFVRVREIPAPPQSIQQFRGSKSAGGVSGGGGNGSFCVLTET